MPKFGSVWIPKDIDVQVDLENAKRAAMPPYSSPPQWASDNVTYGQGNIDLTNRPRVRNSNGSMSTVRSMSFNEDGQEILIPTVSDDGRIMSNQEAIDQYHRTGRYLGKFNSIDESNQYAQSLHESQSKKITMPEEEPWWMRALRGLQVKDISQEQYNQMQGKPPTESMFYKPVSEALQPVYDWGNEPVMDEPTYAEKYTSEVMEGKPASPVETTRFGQIIRKVPLELMPMYKGVKPGKLPKTAPKVEVPPVEPSKPVAPPVTPQPEDSLTKIIRAVDAAEPASIEARTKFMTPDLAKKVKVYRENLEKATNFEEAQKARSALKNALDIGDYNPALVDFNDVDKKFMFDSIMDSELKSLEKGNAIDAVVKVMNQERIQPYEAKMLRNLFNKPKEPIGVGEFTEFPSERNAKALDFLNILPNARRTQLENNLKRVGLNLIDALGIPKAMKFAFDFSMMNRQLGISGARHPISWLKTWKPYFQSMKNEEVALKTNEMLLTDPERMEAIAKLGLDPFKVTKNTSYWDRPETMASKIAEKYIPGVRMSNRGAGVAVNFFMTDVGKKAMKSLKAMNASEEEYKAMGSLINELVGRGEMPKVLHGTAGDIINKLLSSPRYLASRFEWPTKLFSSSKAVRQEAWSTLAAWAGVNTAILGIGTGLGAAAGADPRSADFLKLKVGDKHIDIWVGYAQIARMMAQLAPYVDESGNVDWTQGSRVTASGDVVPVSRGEIIGRFAQSKESPGIGAIVSLLTGKNYVGQKIDFNKLGGWAEFIKEMITPASLEEIADAYFLEGVPSALLSTIGLSGVGVNTYKSEPSGKWTPESILEEARKKRDEKKKTTSEDTVNKILQDALKKRRK